MNSKPLLFASFAVALAHAGALRAAESEDDLLRSFGEEEFLSIATGQKQLIAKAPAVASVITAEEIEQRGATTLEEALESVPGVHVSLSSSYLIPVYSVRGIYTDKNPQVLVLINGVPITQVHFGNRARTLVPVRDIARIEVIRGPGSAVYGADALAGVVNVITKSAEQIDGTEVGARVASFDTDEGWLLHGSKWGEVEVAFSLQALSTDGDDSRRVSSDSQTIFDQALAGLAPPVSRAPGPLDTRNPEQVDARLDLKYRDFQLRLYNWRQDDTGVGPGLALALDPRGNAEADSYLVDAHYTNADLIRDSVVEFNASYMDTSLKTEQTLFPSGAVLPIGPDGNITNDFTNFVPMLFTDGYRGNPDIFEKQGRVEGIVTYNGFEGHSVRVATGFTKQDETVDEKKNYGPGVLDLANRPCTFAFCVIDGTLTNVSNTPWVFMDDQDRDDWYVSLQDQWQLANDWNLTAGVRYDDYSDFGSTVNPRAALVWDSSTDLTAKLLYGRAFRAPSFAELFAINNPVALGNPDLDPETSDTYELALDYRLSFDVRFGFNVFYYKIEDLIEFVPTSSGDLVAQNASRQNGKGFEVETEWTPAESLRVVANYAFVKAEDEVKGQDAGRSPEQQAYVRATWGFADKWQLTGEYKWVGDRAREPNDPRDRIDDYSMGNINLVRKELFKHLDLAFRVRNVFDENAAEPSPYANVPNGSLIPDDFPLEERSYELTARVRF